MQSVVDACSMAERPWRTCPDVGDCRRTLSAVGAAARSFARSRVSDGWVAVGCDASVLATRSSERSQDGRSPGAADRFAPATRGDLRFDSDVAMALVLAATLLTGLATVGVAVELSGDPAGDEGYTNLSLLTEDENGTLVARGYPTEYRRGEARTMYVSVGNHEGETVEYTLIAKVQRINETDGSTVVREETELTRAEQRVPSGETYRFEHAVRPRLTGTDLRLVYLLYRGEPPDDPAIDNAYRSVRLRINVSANQAVNRR